MTANKRTDIKIKTSYSRFFFCLAIPLLFTLSCWGNLDDTFQKVFSSREKLLSAIQSAQSTHDSAVESTTVGSYTAGAKAPLQTAITSANTVYNNPASTNSDYDNARAALDSALSAFDLWRIRHLDVVFILDTTGDMAANMAPLKAFITSNILPNIQAKNSDTKFGLIELNEFIIEGGSLPNGYLVRNNLTTNSAAVLASVNALSAGAGGDPDEAHVAAMKGAADDISWTSGSDRIVILFTSSPAHKIPNSEPLYPGPSWAEANAAITAANINPVGVHYNNAMDLVDLNSFFLPLGGMVSSYGAFNLDAIMNTYTTWW